MPTILTPDDPALEQLCQELSQRADSLRSSNDFPFEQLKSCADFGVFRWFSDERWGGLNWSTSDIYRGYMKMSAACLTTTFVITQRQGATRRIENSGNNWAAEQLISDLMAGEIFATVGLSHLTTSRRHLGKPAMLAKPVEGGFELDGISPWVTGANAADWVVVGASMEDDRQILIVVDMRSKGVQVNAGPELVALSASQTGSIECDKVFVSDKWLLAGPIENVMSSGVGARTGGLQTSALALGLTKAAIDFIRGEAINRTDLHEVWQALNDQQEALAHQLFALADGDDESKTMNTGVTMSPMDLRSESNNLVLRATQAALSAAKGAGYLAEHPVGRWCREALFFLVWSCPQSVMNANLCQFAGIDDDSS